MQPQSVEWNRFACKLPIGYAGPRYFLPTIPEGVHVCVRVCVGAAALYAIHIYFLRTFMKFKFED